MDVLALTTFLAPCLPFLLEKVGAPALHSAANKLGEETWNIAKAIWAKLQPKVESEAAAKIASEKLAEKPESTAWQEALKDELTTILNNDAILAKAIADLLKDTPIVSGGNVVQQTVQNNQGQVIGMMSGGEAKNIAGIDTVQSDVNL
ncbi:MAG: hypothetical protein AAGA75_12235 [Cyanobacteria bacterium P01_E01_bin.6]